MKIPHIIFLTFPFFETLLVGLTPRSMNAYISTKDEIMTTFKFLMSLSFSFPFSFFPSPLFLQQGVGLPPLICTHVFIHVHEELLFNKTILSYPWRMILWTLANS